MPDTLSAIYEYPDRFHLNYSCFFGNDQYGYGEQFMGRRAPSKYGSPESALLLTAEVHQGSKTVLETDQLRSI